MGWGEEGLPDLAVKVNILPGQVEDFLAMAGPLGGQPFSQGMVADVGSGVVRHLWWSDEGNSGTGLFVEKMISEYREWARRHNGHVVVERCPQEVKGNIDVWGDSLEGMAIMRRIKKELDPAGVLNPGRFAGRI